MMMTIMPRHVAAEGEVEFQSEEKLEESRDAPARELEEAKLSEGEAKKRLSDQDAELNFAAGWQVEATEEEDGMGDLVDLPLDKDEEVQRSRMQKDSQPWEKLDKVIEGIRRLMLKSALEAVSEEELSRGETTIATGKHMQQQQQSSGADGQLQRTVWDLGGFQ
jgi:hypothetical protein